MAKNRLRKKVELGLKLHKLLIIYIVVLSILAVTSLSNAFSSGFGWHAILWASYTPVVIVGIGVALKQRRAKATTRSGGSVDNQISIAIITLARQDVMPALCRVIDSVLESAPSCLLNFKLFVVIEEGASGKKDLEERYGREKHMSIIEVPRAYRTKGATKYKARSAQYLLEQLDAEQHPDTSSCWYYQLDDDSAMTLDIAESLREKIEEDNQLKLLGLSSKFHLGQGVLAFPFELSKSWLARLADSIRPADDLSSYYLATSILGTPLFGLHGENLLIRLSVLLEIGWDFGDETLEDSRFALEFSQKYPGMGTFLPSCSYGASPGSVRDLMTQRRRWSFGMQKLASNRNIPFKYRLGMWYRTYSWVTGALQSPITVGIITGLGYTLGVNLSLLDISFLLLWPLTFGYQLWLYIEGLRINLSVSSFKRSKPSYPLLSLLIILFMPIFAFMEGIPAIQACWDDIRKQGSRFVVITKTDGKTILE